MINKNNPKAQNSTSKIDLKFNTKFIKSPWLVNYWTFNSHIKDVIGGAHLFNGINASLTSDRFGRPLSALSLSSGFYQMPTRNYFPTGQFTITAWLKLRAYNKFSRLIDFSNGALTDTINLNTRDDMNNFRFRLYKVNSIVGTVNSLAISLNTWTHVSLSYGNYTLSIYYNGTLKNSNQTSAEFRNMTRSYNYIGRSSNYVGGDQNLNAVVDEVKLFNKALSQKEIEHEMNNQL